MTSVRTAAGLALAAAALTACGSSKAAAPSAAAPAATTAACPSVSTPPVRWPGIVPSDLPKPAGAVLTSESVQNNVVYLRFTTSTSLREGLLFMLQQLPKAGYTLGRGDSEATEADLPFSNAAIIGALRLTVDGPCATSWILAVSRHTSTGVTEPDQLIPHTPPSDESSSTG